MKIKDFNSLRNGDKVQHKHLGPCTVVDFIPDFGPTIVPDTDSGKMLLAIASGMPPGTPLLETSYRLLQQLPENNTTDETTTANH